MTSYDDAVAVKETTLQPAMDDIATLCEEIESAMKNAADALVISNTYVTTDEQLAAQVRSQ